jgi:site-specific recombinase XerD
MRSEQLTMLKQEHLRHVKNAGAPDHAGIRSESHQETYQAYPTAFFRQKRGRVWEPHVVMEPNAVQERMRQTIDFMIQHIPFQRDKIILLLLRQTGARLSEVIEMTVGGYRRACHTGQALVKNKGSRGREEKLIYFTNVIEEQLLHYVRTERAEYDPQGRKQLDQLDDGDALFLTDDGKPYTRSAFYFHWYRLLESAQQRFKKQEQVTFSPHDLRHLHVTQNISKIRAKANGDKGLEEDLLNGFSHLMGWRSRQTMDTYTHVLNKRQALLEIVLAEDENQRPISESLNHTTSVMVADHTDPHREPPPEVPPTTAGVQLDDDMSWYEE